VGNSSRGASFHNGRRRAFTTAADAPEPIRASLVFTQAARSLIYQLKILSAISLNNLGYLSATSLKILKKNKKIISK